MAKGVKAVKRTNGFPIGEVGGIVKKTEIKGVQMDYRFLDFRMQDAEDRGRIEMRYDSEKEELQMRYWANNPISIAEGEAFQNRIKIKKRLEADLE